MDNKPKRYVEQLNGVLTFINEKGERELITRNPSVIIDQKGNLIEEDGTFEFVSRWFQVFLTKGKYAGTWTWCKPLIMYPECIFKTRLSYTVKLPKKPKL